MMDQKIAKAAKKIISEHSRIPREVLAAVQTLSERHSCSARLDAHHAVRSALGIGGTVCAKTDLLFLSGRDVTDATGRCIVPLQTLLCRVATEGLEDFLVASSFVIAREPIVVATPFSAAPVFLTTLAHSTPREVSHGEFLLDRGETFLTERTYLDDVSVEVLAWQLNGAPAGETEFAWVCAIEAVRKGYLPG